MSNEQAHIDICMILDTPATFDSRVKREAQSLAAAGWNVLIVSVSPLNNSRSQESMDGYIILSVPVEQNQLTKLWDLALKICTYALVLLMLPLPEQFFLWKWLRRLFLGTSRSWLTRYRSLTHEVKQIEATFYHAHDYLNLTVPSMAKLDQKRVIYDSHELFFDQYQPPNISLFVTWLATHKRNIERTIERDLCQQSAAVVTISDRVSDRMADLLSIPRPIVVRNLVDIRNLAEPAYEYPAQGYRRIVHTGNLNPGRRLHELIEAVALLPEDIALILMGKGHLAPSLEEHAVKFGIAERFFIVPPVLPHQIISTMAQADAAVSLIPNQGIHFDLTFPQKFFEAIGAALPIVTGSTSSVLDIINEWDFGVVTDPDDPRAIADAFEELFKAENYTKFKANVENARAVLNWENEEKRLIQLYQTLFHAE